jgi:hypothetical protein
MSSPQERENRRKIYCTSESAVKAWELQKERSRNCDVPLVPQEQFYIPEEAPILQPPTVIPDGIIIFSQERTFTCLEFTGDGVGVPVTIPYGQYFANISYLSVPNITDSQLFDISRKDQNSLNYELSRENFEVLNDLGLNRSQREFLENEVKANIGSLKALVFQVGTGSLVCTFLSDAVTYGCPADTYLNGEPPGASLFYPAGFRQSEVSKANANQKVYQIALSELQSCLTGNDPVTERCPPGFFIGPIKLDTGGDLSGEGVGEGLESIGGYFTVDKNSFFAQTKEEANLLASEFAKESLICVYCNDELILPVCNPGDRPPTVPAGALCRDTIEELIQAIADFIDSAVLNCVVFNDPVTCKCSESFDGHDLDSYDEAEITIAGGQFPSDTKAEANALAREACEDALIDFCYNEKDDGDGDGGGGDDDKEECEDEDCACMSLEDAEEQFGVGGFEFCVPEDTQLVNGKPPTCKVVVEKIRNELTGVETLKVIPHYCIKEKDDDDDDDDDDGGGGGGGGDEGQGCPSGCECVENMDKALEEAGDKFEFISCEDASGKPAIGFCVDFNKFDYCHKLVPKERECCEEGEDGTDGTDGNDGGGGGGGGGYGGDGIYGGTGSLTSVDCDGNERVLLTWVNGIVTTNDNIKFNVGACSFTEVFPGYED